MWRSARRSWWRSGGRTGGASFTINWNQTGSGYERRVHRVSGDVEQTVGRTVRAYGSGALRPLCFDRPESIYRTGRYRARSRALDRDADGAPLSKRSPRPRESRATSERLRGMAHDGAGGVRELSLRDPTRHARRGARPRPAHAHAPRRPRAYRARIITACS